MKSADIVIIGGGLVGLTLAARLAQTDCHIYLIEPNAPPRVEETFSYRVSAINPTSEAILRRCGAWQAIPTSRLSPYERMCVREKDSFARLEFDCRDAALGALGLTQLGYIVENNQLHVALWQQVSQQSNVQWIAARPSRLGISESGAFLTLDNGEMLSASLVVGADGAHSWVRQQSHIPLIQRDYQHSALVCNVTTAEPHQHTARQLFSPDSILAFLPMPDPHVCSIVWSLPPQQAEHLVQCEDTAFNQALAVAFDHQLGLVSVQSNRVCYPLTARYARDFAAHRLALIGDAAHTIHPLAGLGLNLGLADAEALAEHIQQLWHKGVDIGEYRYLRPFERRRKVEAVKLLATMEGLKQLFAGDHPLKKWIRGVGLSMTNQPPMLKKWLIEQAIGV